MLFRETPIGGAWVVDVEPIADERGLFARTFDANLFEERGLSGEVIQCSTSLSPVAPTLRGLHYQADPHGECKLVRCTAGAVYDVLVDLRPSSPTHCRWYAVELSSENRRALYIPPGVAHGFQTLVDGSEMLYMIDRRYRPEAARGVRWDDPTFGIEWPDPVGARIMSERDRTYSDYGLAGE
jgi:dTDP-4-dehydrorhamnose 3,5-epimerase